MTTAPGVVKGSVDDVDVDTLPGKKDPGVTAGGVTGAILGGALGQLVAPGPLGAVAGAAVGAAAIGTIGATLSYAGVAPSNVASIRTDTTHNFETHEATTTVSDSEQ